MALRKPLYRHPILLRNFPHVVEWPVDEIMAVLADGCMRKGPEGAPSAPARLRWAGVLEVTIFARVCSKNK